MAQSRSSIGILPEVSVSHRWAGDSWRLTGQVESMQRLWYTAGGEALSFNYSYIRTDFTLMLSHRISPDWSLAIGNMGRFVNGQFVYRALQQLSFARRGPMVRTGHRVRLDQTFADSEATSYRLRYRFAIEVPIRGLSLNAREWYAKSSVEQLLSLRDGRFAWEQRLASALGRYFNAKNKLELGFDYRLDDFTDRPGRHRIWTTVSYYLNL